MDEHRIFDFLEKLYFELQTGKKELKDEIAKNSRHLVRLENEVKEKTGILFDGQRSLQEQGVRLERKMDRIAQILEDHEVRLRVIESGG